MRLGIRRYVLPLLAIIALMSMALAACGSSTSPQGGKAPDSKQVLHYPIVNNASDLAHLDPPKIGDFYSQQVAMLIFPPLVELNDNLDTVPWGASSFSTSSDGLTVTFNIKPGMKWTDGTPIDANSYAYALNRALDPCTGGPLVTFLYPIAGAAAFNGGTCPPSQASALNPTSTKTLIGTSITATDAQTLVIKLGAPAAYFVPALTTTVAFPVPKELIDQYGNKDWTNHLADGSGFGGSLFKVTSWPHTGTLTLTRNDSQTVFPKPTLREIDITIYKLGEPMQADYRNGRLDTTGANNIPASAYLQAKTQSDFHSVPYLDIGYLEPNWLRPPFDNLLAREAFAVAINRDAIATNIAHGASIPSWHIVPKGNPGYNDNLMGVQGAPTAGDPAKATADIQQYAATACGGQLAKCPPVTYETDNTTTAVKESQALLQMWQTAMPGYPITLHNVDFNTLLNDIFGASSGKAVPQLFGIGYSLDYPDEQDWLGLQFGPGSIPYLAGVNTDTTLQTDMQKCDTEAAPARVPDCQAAEQEAVNQVAWTITTQGTAIWESHSNVHGFVLNGAGMPAIDDWANNIYITQ
jgi:oligopeptide transport system substrate-binding protein